LGQDRVVDLEASCDAWLSAKGIVRSAAIAGALFPQSTRGLLEGGSATQDMLGAMVDTTKAGTWQPVSHTVNTVRLHAPINDLGKFMCIGLNYKDHMTLSPGDLISTGTPAGVGFSRKPAVTLQPGDVCKLEITGLGTLEKPVKDA
jgi:2-keto-4-pentenoate hydratase/2-oxohepta-3-ene-1,7-dioic acid hydratase in catechol pathway